MIRYSEFAHFGRKWGRRLGRSVVIFSAAVLAMNVIYRERNVLGAGKPRPPASQPTTQPVCTLPSQNPIRPIVLRKVSTKAFQLPNGAMVDLSADLDALLASAAAQTQVLTPEDGASPKLDPCEEHLELAAAVSVLELNAFEAGVTFGYSPTGTENPITSLTGNVNVKVGNIAMEFGILHCRGAKCQRVIPATATHITAGVGTQFSINFSEVKLGVDLMTKTQLGSLLSAIMKSGMNAAVQSPNLIHLPWSATVGETDATTGSFAFDAGASQRLSHGMQFEVYAVTPGQSACSFKKTVAYGTAVQVDGLSTVAVVDKILDPRGIQVGDMVRLRAPR